MTTSIFACVVHACVHLFGFVQAITCTFKHGFENNMAQLFSLTSRFVVVVLLFYVHGKHLR